MEQRTFDELISHFNSIVSKWEIDKKYKLELLGMISSIGYEHEKMLNNLPSAEPNIIRCKDCKWKQGSECVRFADVRPFPDDFCSRAERRTDE